MLKNSLFIILLGAFLFSGIVLAQNNNLPDPGRLPGHPLYFLEKWGESIGTFFTFDDMAKTERHLFLAEKRIAEVKALAEKGRSDFAERTLEQYRRQLNQALDRAEKAKKKGLDTDEVLVKISDATFKHNLVLVEVYKKIPEKAKPAVQKAMEQSIDGHQRAFGALTEQKREQVKEDIETRKREAFQKAESVGTGGELVPENISKVSPAEPSVISPVELPATPPAEISFLDEFPNKVVYTMDINSDRAVFQEDCEKRGGVFNPCGSVCPPGAEMCILVCAYTCEF